MKILLLSTMLLCGLVAAPAANLGGKWQLALTTPHGPMTGSLDLKQDGDKVSGTCTTERFGAAPLTGSTDGKTVSFSIEVQGMTFSMSGTVNGEKMSGTIDPDVGSWSATRDAPAAATGFVLGSVADIHPDSLEFVIKLDNGVMTPLPVGAGTEVVRPGDLA